MGRNASAWTMRAAGIVALMLAAITKQCAAADSCKSCVSSGSKWCFAEFDNGLTAYSCTPASESCPPPPGNANFNWQVFDSQLDCIYGGENGEALIAPIVIGCLLIVGIVAYVIHLIRAYAPPKLSREDAEGIPVADPRVRVDSGSPDHSAATGPVPIAKTVLPEQSPADSLA